MAIGTSITFATVIGFAGNLLSEATQAVIKFVSQYGINITALQTKILLFVLLGVALILVIAFLKVAQKIIKWLVVAGIAFLVISLVASMFK